jgi:hypothetical protein
MSEWTYSVLAGKRNVINRFVQAGSVNKGKSNGRLGIWGSCWGLKEWLETTHKHFEIFGYFKDVFKWQFKEKLITQRLENQG